jgi:hypothetical protein
MNNRLLIVFVLGITFHFEVFHSLIW